MLLSLNLFNLFLLTLNRYNMVSHKNLYVCSLILKVLASFYLENSFQDLYAFSLLFDLFINVNFIKLREKLSFTIWLVLRWPLPELKMKWFDEQSHKRKLSCLPLICKKQIKTGTYLRPCQLSMIIFLAKIQYNTIFTKSSIKSATKILWL